MKLFYGYVTAQNLKHQQNKIHVLITCVDIAFCIFFNNVVIGIVLFGET